MKEVRFAPNTLFALLLADAAGGARAHCCALEAGTAGAQLTLFSAASIYGCDDVLDSIESDDVNIAQIVTISLLFPPFRQKSPEGVHQPQSCLDSRVESVD